ncbi:MAG: rhodanese-like domain-containing protein [Methylobacteriaceae bacterium]|nr:rhodanese-like domain-containing protein [Methylobacteriaceae bacterium]
MTSEVDSISTVEEMTAVDANDLWLRDPTAQLIDVRTRAEWTYVGAPTPVAGCTPIFCEWQSYPDMQIRAGFVAELTAELAARGVGPTAPLLFLCRSGVRSRAAAQAMRAAGYQRCVNITEGFQGPPDGNGHRSRVSGWQAAGLPWRQG